MVIFEFGGMLPQLLWGSLLLVRFRMTVSFGFFLGCFTGVLASLEYSVLIHFYLFLQLESVLRFLALVFCILQKRGICQLTGYYAIWVPETSEQTAKRSAIIRTEIRLFGSCSVIPVQGFP